MAGSAGGDTWESAGLFVPDSLPGVATPRGGDPGPTQQYFPKWWTFTAPVDGKLSINTYASTYDLGETTDPDTILTVYTGADEGSKVQVARNDDTDEDDVESDQELLSRVLFDVVEGETYHILAGTYDDVFDLVTAFVLTGTLYAPSDWITDGRDRSGSRTFQKDDHAPESIDGDDGVTGSVFINDFVLRSRSVLDTNEDSVDHTDDMWDMLRGEIASDTGGTGLIYSGNDAPGPSGIVPDDDVSWQVQIWVESGPGFPDYDPTLGGSMRWAGLFHDLNGSAFVDYPAPPDGALVDETGLPEFEGDPSWSFEIEQSSDAGSALPSDGTLDVNQEIADLPDGIAILPYPLSTSSGPPGSDPVHYPRDWFDVGEHGTSLDLELPGRIVAQPLLFLPDHLDGGTKLGGTVQHTYYRRQAMQIGVNYALNLPRYRWYLPYPMSGGVVPAARKYPREDGLGVGGARRWPQPRSQQASGRRAGGFY